jgi:hypothetical protein
MTRKRQIKGNSLLIQLWSIAVQKPGESVLNRRFLASSESQ